MNHQQVEVNPAQKRRAALAWCSAVSRCSCLAQLQGFLNAEREAGRVAVIDGEIAGDPVAAVSACAHWLTLATDAAESARHALEQAHATLGRTLD